MLYMLRDVNRPAGLRFDLAIEQRQAFGLLPCQQKSMTASHIVAPLFWSALTTRRVRLDSAVALTVVFVNSPGVVIDNW